MKKTKSKEEYERDAAAGRAQSLNFENIELRHEVEKWKNRYLTLLKWVIEDDHAAR